MSTESLDGRISSSARDVLANEIQTAGGNEVFNTLQISWIDHDFHMTFFTSCAVRSAEDTWRDFRDELISLAKGEPAAAFTDTDGVN